VDRRAQAAAVNAMASAISHRMARSLSVSALASSATQRIGEASVSTCRPLATKEAHSAFIQGCQATRFPVALLHERRTSPALGFHDSHGSRGPPPPRGLPQWRVAIGLPAVIERLHCTDANVRRL
jgi:hypothetical protein